MKVVTDPLDPLRVQIIENSEENTGQSRDQVGFSRGNVDPLKKRYKIAYFIMAHANKKCLMAMMDALYSTEAIYLIHVDANFPDFKEEIKEWVEYSKFNNVHVMKASFYGQWGSSSLVFIELEGFFQLIDMAEWDYVINLSVYDYPLANTSTIHYILEKTPQKSYLAYWAGDLETMRRLSFTAFTSESKKHFVIDFRRPRFFPWVGRFTPMKQSQWMVIFKD